MSLLEKKFTRIVVAAAVVTVVGGTLGVVIAAASDSSDQKPQQMSLPEIQDAAHKFYVVAAATEISAVSVAGGVVAMQGPPDNPTIKTKSDVGDVSLTLGEASFGRLTQGVSPESVAPVTAKFVPLARFWCVSAANPGGTKKFVWQSSDEKTPTVGDVLPSYC